MASFAAMMQMSHAQTAQKQAAVEAMAAERKRKEQETKKRQLEQEKKRREEEAKLRQKHFEDQKKEAEREKQKEERRRAVEAERQKREDAQRDALLGKKASSSSKYPSSASHSRARAEVRKTRLPSEEDEDGSPRGEILTRQEIRERKLQQRLKREFGTKRSTITAGYQRHGRRLPGGAVDVTVTNRQQMSDSGSGNVKQRLSALPNTLQPLNQNKRDTRTIDEIVTQLHANKKKTIEGEDAKVFDDWFGNKKKEQPQSRMGSSAPASGSNTPKSSRESFVGRVIIFFYILPLSFFRSQRNIHSRLFECHAEVLRVDQAHPQSHTLCKSFGIPCFLCR
ncbi:hypothetical protein VKT23_008375 [Stygiomarasmius scandens]|uniref:Uncharacterized protein n=1 Tax=Marasmiellus scandens TaxID=2682957 RepID=A0ABR1JI18_9AGAR